MYNPVLVRDHDPLKCPVPKQHHQDTQYKHIHTKSVYQIFDILYATIEIMIYGIQYLRSVMQNRPQITDTLVTVSS